jgi:phosphatidylglycerophosphate synthase
MADSDLNRRPIAARGSGWAQRSAAVLARTAITPNHKASVFGRIYNEFPDRLTDTLLIVALGYACAVPWLGWLGALLAVATAYVRVFGGSLGLTQDFRGPLAKAHRMAVLTVACIAGAAESYWHPQRYALLAAAIVIAIGSLLTCITRTLAIAKLLRGQR